MRIVLARSRIDLLARRLCPTFAGVPYRERRTIVSMQSRPRLDLYLPDGKLMAAVGPGAGMKFVEDYFPEAEKELLIGTAYFSLRGYALARKHIPDAALIHFLVGKRDGHLVEKAVLEEIKDQLRRIHRETRSRDLYVAVEDILYRLKNRRFRIADARQMMAPFHCKIYIVHEGLAWHARRTSQQTASWGSPNKRR